jgi:hypothetical protein
MPAMTRPAAIRRTPRTCPRRLNTIGSDAVAPDELGGRIGTPTRALVAAILADRRHPEQAIAPVLNSCKLARRHGEARLEVACARA